MARLTVTEQRQTIVKKYRARGQNWPASMREIASWAIREGLWKQSRGAQVSPTC